MSFNVNPASARPDGLAAGTGSRVQAAFLTQAFMWMFVGLLLTAGVAALAQGNERLLAFARDNFIFLLIGIVALPFVIGLGINKVGATVALGLFFVYAAALGLFLGPLVAEYTGASVASAFLSASAIFGAAAIYGYTTKRSLAGLGGYLSMGVVGLIVAMVVNLILGSNPLGFIISIIGVVIFTALTAYDVQRIATGELVARLGSVEKAAVVGALQLYLDFINLFLFMLRLLGGRD